MKLTTTATSLALLAAAITVSAQPYAETNAQRMKRGLGPNPPMRRNPTGVAGARRTHPSSTPGQCNTGPIQCCQHVGRADSNGVAWLLSLLGINVGDASTLVGTTCSPISAIGAGSSSCTAQPVCCSNNNFNGVVAVGCSPVNI